MANKKSNSRLGEMEAQKRATERQEQRNKRWQQVVFIGISLIVLISMIASLFIR